MERGPARARSQHHTKRERSAPSGPLLRTLSWRLPTPLQIPPQFECAFETRRRVLLRRLEQSGVHQGGDDAAYVLAAADAPGGQGRERLRTAAEIGRGDGRDRAADVAAGDVPLWRKSEIRSTK